MADNGIATGRGGASAGKHAHAADRPAAADRRAAHHAADRPATHDVGDRGAAHDVAADVGHAAHAGDAGPAADPATQDILRRLKSAEGHVRGVGRMVEEGAYCIDVLNQILAVQRALKKVSGLMLDRHLHHCVTSAVRGEDPDERERVLREVMEVFQATGRT